MQTSSLAQIDADRFLCVYEYNPEVQTHKGRLNVLTVDTGNWTTTAGLPFEFESDKAEDTTVIHINGEYYLAAYCGPDDDGWAAVLQINSELIVFP